METCFQSFYHFSEINNNRSKIFLKLPQQKKTVLYIGNYGSIQGPKKKIKQKLKIVNQKQNKNKNKKKIKTKKSVQSFYNKNQKQKAKLNF